MVENIVQYLNDILGINLMIKRYESPERVPFYLKGQYDFYRVTLFNHQYVLLYKTENDQTPGELEKHRDTLEAIFDCKTLFGFENIKAYNRTRLIRHNIQFVVPGKQLFLPDLMIDLREIYEKEVIQHDYLTPVTQVLLFYHLLKESIQHKIVTELAGKLPYTKVSLSRAFDEIDRLGLGEFTQKGKNKKLIFTDSGIKLWNKLQPYLRSPILKTKTIFGEIQNIEQNEDLFVSGVNALSEYSMLGGEIKKTYAMYHKHAISSEKNAVGQEIVIEIWRYDPGILAGKTVDPLSLFLTLKDDDDPRIQLSLQEMIGEIKWCMD